MKTDFLLGAGLAALISAGSVLLPAKAATLQPEHEAAVKACSEVNPTQPVTLVNAVNDGSGIGFSLVWLNDNEGNLWMCDADAHGNIYSYTILTGDLLEGSGPELIGLQPASNGSFEEEPQQIAEKVCVAHLAAGGKVLATSPDGLESDPGFIVFVQDSAGAFHLCNATGDAMIWAFEPIGDPLAFEQQTS